MCLSVHGAVVGTRLPQLRQDGLAARHGPIALVLGATCSRVPCADVLGQAITRCLVLEHGGDEATLSSTHWTHLDMVLCASSGKL